MIVSVPPVAPTTPPETGASTKVRPVAATRSAMATMRAGAQVAMTMTDASGFSASSAPPANRTASA